MKFGKECFIGNVLDIDAARVVDVDVEFCLNNASV